MDQVGIDLRVIKIGQFASAGMESFDRALAAHAAARCGVEMTFKTSEVDIDAPVQIDADRITNRSWPNLRTAARRNPHSAFRTPQWSARTTVTYVLDLVGRLKDPLSKKETGGELAIFAGCTHRDRDRTMAFSGNSKPYLERLLDGENVGRVFRGGAGDNAPDGCSLCRAHDCSLAKELVHRRDAETPRNASQSRPYQLLSASPRLCG